MLRLFDHRFEEFAADTHENLAARAGIAVGAGAVSLVALPWRICAMWVVSTLAIEVWGWFATRPQFQRRPVTAAEQAAFLVYLVCIIGTWFYLGALLWLTGALAGAVAGAIVWLSLVGFAQTFASRSPLGFLVSGVAPALGVMLVMTLDPRLDWSERWRMGGMMTLAMGFAIAGARQTFASGQRLEETQARLRESEAQYRALADNTIDVIGRTGVDGIWRYMSPSVEVALGYTPAEMCAVIGPTFIYSDDRPAVRQVTAAVLADGRARTCEYRMIRKDGRMVWVESSFSLARDPVTGDETEIVCHARDVTARKAMERELVEARERAEAAAAAKADFLANMSHELRTPLNAIIGFSGVLKDSRELSERDARHAQLIGDASDTLLLVVNDVLDFSKLESGAFELDPQPFDPMAIALSATMLVEPQAKARGLTLEVIGAGGSRKLMVDGPRLRQVLLNLLVQRAEVHPRRRGHRAGGAEPGPRRWAGGRGGRPAAPQDLGQRHRHRHLRRQAGGGVRALQPGRRLGLAALRRHRPRPCHLQADRRADGRLDRRRKPQGRGFDVLVRDRPPGGRRDRHVARPGGRIRRRSSGRCGCCWSRTSTSTASWCG